MPYRLLAGAAVSALMIAGSAASAEDHGRRHDSGWNSGWGHSYDRGGHYRHHDDNDDDAALLIGGAIVGLALGAIIADSASDGPSYNSGYSSYDYGYSSPSYDYGYSSYDYGYASPSYGYSQPSYDYSAPTYNYATPAPSYGYTSPNSGVTYVANTNQPCSQVRSGRTATGAVIGGVIGGLIGNGVAADKNRDEGTAVGAALGSVIGGSIGHGSAECGGAAPAVYNTPAVYTPPAPTTGYSDPYADPYRGLGSSPSYEPDYPYQDELYGGPDSSSGADYSGPAAEECQRVMQVTTLPDGTEIHKPVEACRQAYYGDWSVQK